MAFPCEGDKTPLTQEAISYYQSASDMYRDGTFREVSAVENAAYLKTAEGKAVVPVKVAGLTKR